MYKRTAALHNLGCKVNSYEIEASAQVLKEGGYEIVPFAPGADIYIINTCSVTNIADKKSRQMLHKARKMNPDAIVIAMGCYAQAAADVLEKDDAVDIIIGNNKKKDLIRIIDDYRDKHSKAKYLEDLSRGRDYEQLSVTAPAEHIRGFMKVQDGCDMFCSYCIIPYVRGRVRSRSIEDAVKEAEMLAAGGCREVVLSGIHLSSYGKDIDKNTGLLDLIKAIHEVEGVSRIRLGSLEPGIITEEFAEELSRLPKVCPHFHLSLQSGCDKTLKAMNRRYDTAGYREKCEILRRFFDDPSITTDVITGFPGENEEDFEETFAFVDEMDFFETHIFPYSIRQGTKAAAMPEQLTEAVKKERAARLIDLNKEKMRQHFEKLKGCIKEVLIEEVQTINGEEFWVGHTREYEKIAVRSDEDLKNKPVNVKITEVQLHDHVFGEFINFL